MMQGFIPNSDEFLILDPEHVDEYRQWQRFAKSLVYEQRLPTSKLQHVSKIIHLKRNIRK